MKPSVGVGDDCSGPVRGRFAVFSYRYDAHLVPDLIANIAPVVDGCWIALNDRPSEGYLLTDTQHFRRCSEPAACPVLISGYSGGADMLDKSVY